MNDCPECGGFVHPKRIALGYFLCLKCGEAKAISARRTWTVAPMNKSNYILVTNKDVLKQLNPKRTP